MHSKMNEIKLINMKLIFKIISILCFVNTIYSDLIEISNDNFSIKKIKDETPLKIYLVEEIENYIELLYLEFSISDDINNSTIIKNNYSPYYKISVNWFNNISIDKFSKGVFFGIGQMKIFEKQNIFFDLKICKLFHIINKCEDYFMNISISDPSIFSKFYNSINSSYINETKNYADYMFTNEFSPILDITHINGTDDIYFYETFPVNYENINEFKSHIRFKIIQGIYSKDKHDLNFDLNNLLYVFFGSYDKILFQLNTTNISILQRNDFKVKIKKISFLI